MTAISPVTPTREINSLDGVWMFALDPHDIGEDEGWYSRELDGAIRIPGSWEEQGYGDRPTSQPLSGWDKQHQYEGAAWYVRRIDVSETWAGKSVELTMNGVRWHSRVWLGGAYVGEFESLSVPHRYDLTPFLKPGSSQQLAVRIDNRMRYPLAESHINSTHTATRWGGIAGGVELAVRPRTGLKSIKCRPNIAARRFDFEVEVGDAVAGLALDVTVTNSDSGEKTTGSALVDGSRITVSIEMGDLARLWWDDDPFLYGADFTLRQDDVVLDVVQKRVGLREIAVQGRQITLNGRPIFLRGYVDCCIFPQTGYPVWDIDQYRRQLTIAKSYGFNHVRLHSWTAPTPFWNAADELGMLVQTELPNWTREYGHREIEPAADVHGFLMRELELIVDSLNLHPSWVMLSNGNELIYENEGHPRLLELSARGKQLDQTRLFTDNTGFGQLPAPSRKVDYYIQSCNWHPPKKIYDAASNDTTQDFEAITALSNRPVIGHEHGQFTMYVRPSEQTKYTGVIRPTWLESIQETFEAKGMSDRVEGYIHASGIHIVRAYKENIERARRTRNLSGIQLLDIRDFPGQGHATTGILDVFWDSKGLITAEDFARFNGAIVLLARYNKPTFWTGEPITVEIDVSNFGHETLAGEPLRWELRERQGSSQSAQRIHDTGQLDIPDAPNGQLTHLASLSVPTPGDGAAHAWELVVSLGKVTNSWHIWSFPYPAVDGNYRAISTRLPLFHSALPGADFSDDYLGLLKNIDKRGPAYRPTWELAISDILSLSLLQYLHDGGRVWLMPGADRLYDQVRTRYLPPFWSYLWFPENISTVMGTLIHPHPALERFPHDGLSDWQWYDLVNDAPALCLDAVPHIQPIVEVVDNFNRAKRLCYAFEAQVGKGRLFVSTWRLKDPAVFQRPEARFLFSEILGYLRREAFMPNQKLSIGQLLSMVKLTNNDRPLFD